MNILVTGGAGYIGSHAARFLGAQGHEVWVLDNFVTGHLAAGHLAAGHSEAGHSEAGHSEAGHSEAGHSEAAVGERLVQADLRDEGGIVEILRDQRIEAVMHFAAFSQVGESVVNPAKYYRNNVVGTCTLLEAMRIAGVSRIVFSSTAATYGTPLRVPITEEEPQRPINPYGFTKLVIEQALRDYTRAYGWGYAALRYFNAAGAAADGTLGEDHDPETHLIPLVLQVALGQRPSITVFGNDYDTPDGTCIRDYIHVEDLAAAHLAALERLTPGSGLEMNLGTGNGYSVQEVIDACRRVTGHPIPVVLGTRRAGDPAVLVADSSLAQRVLEWTPRYTSIDGIVESAWNWHRRHPGGYPD